MARKLRIALIGTSIVTTGLAAVVGVAYIAAQYQRPFYQQALQLDPQTLAAGSRELESRATALYSDARQVGQWHALFTDAQINGWLAVQLTEGRAGKLPDRIREPRIAILPDMLTLGFRTTQGGVETIISVDAGVFLTDDGAVAIRLLSVRAGALPLPVTPIAEQLATACERLKLPVRWTQQHGQPVALVEIESEKSSNRRRFHLDTIELGEGELYVAGRTEKASGPISPIESASATHNDRGENRPVLFSALADYELRLTRRDEGTVLEIGRRPDSAQSSAGR